MILRCSRGSADFISVRASACFVLSLRRHGSCNRPHPHCVTDPICHAPTHPRSHSRGRRRRLRRRFCLQELVEWLDDNNFVKALFAGHTQLIRRSGDVLGFLCRERALSEKHLDIIWAAGGGGQDKDRRICVHEVGGGCGAYFVYFFMQ